MIKKDLNIYIAGHGGMVGSAIWRELKARGYTNIIGRRSNELDLRNQTAVSHFFEIEKPDVVIDAAARVGGILANSNYPYTFLMDNLLIQNNLINVSHQFNVGKFIFLGSSCIYPKLAPQPLKEDSLLTGPLEPTNEWYAVAKIAGVKACEAIRIQYKKDFLSLMPTNLYGPNDNFDLETSHVLPAMIRKFHEAKRNDHAPVALWGSGNPMREFLYVDDLAEAVVFALENSLQEHLYNVGTGEDMKIRDLAEIIQHIVGHKGEILWDAKKPDGTPRKLMDVNKLKNEGWKAATSLVDGIEKTYRWYLENPDEVRTIKLT